MDVEHEGGVLCLHNNKDTNLRYDSNSPIGSHSNKELLVIVGSSYELRVHCVESIDWMWTFCIWWQTGIVDCHLQ